MSYSKDDLTPLLEANESWASRVASSDPSFFPESSKGQAPHTLWLGCADSRVPETTLLGASPGDVFVHRNIANILSPTDLASLALIEFAVKVVKVKQVVVCGHTACGGCTAAMGNARVGGKLDAWLMPLRELRHRMKAELAEEKDEGKRKDMLSEANVKRGVQVLRENPDVREEIKARGLKLFGVMYDLKEGKLRRVDCGEEKGESEVFECE